MWDAAGESTNAAARPNSSGSPYLRNGMCSDRRAAHLIGIAAKGIKVTDLSAAILTGSSPSVRRCGSCYRSSR